MLKVTELQLLRMDPSGAYFQRGPNYSGNGTELRLTKDEWVGMGKPTTIKITLEKING